MTAAPRRPDAAPRTDRARWAAVRTVAALLLLSAATAAAAYLLQGHRPSAGRTVWVLTRTHGINEGDLPVIAAWVACAALCGLLAAGRRRPQARHVAVRVERGR